MDVRPLGSLHHRRTRDHVSHAELALDKDGNGSIDFAEFVGAFRLVDTSAPAASKIA